MVIWVRAHEILTHKPIHAMGIALSAYEGAKVTRHGARDHRGVRGNEPLRSPEVIPMLVIQDAARHCYWTEADMLAPTMRASIVCGRRRDFSWQAALSNQDAPERSCQNWT